MGPQQQQESESFCDSQQQTCLVNFAVLGNKHTVLLQSFVNVEFKIRFCCQEEELLQRFTKDCGVRFEFCLLIFSGEELRKLFFAFSPFSHRLTQCLTTLSSFDLISVCRTRCDCFW